MIWRRRHRELQRRDTEAIESTFRFFAALDYPDLEPAEALERFHEGLAASAAKRRAEKAGALEAIDQAIANALSLGVTYKEIQATCLARRP